MKHPDNASYGISCFPGLKHWCGTFQQSSKARAPYIYSDNAFLGGRVDDHGVPAFHTPAHNHPRAHCTNGLRSRLLGMIPGACHLSEPVIYIDCGQDSCWAIRLPAEHDPRRTLLRDFVPQRSWRPLRSCDIRCTCHVCHVRKHRVSLCVLVHARLHVKPPHRGHV